MNQPRDRDPDLERLLDADGGELGRLYRRLPHMEPPRRIDRSVLGEAARAVHGRTPRAPRWIVGMGSAAGLVLAAGIAWHVGHDTAMSPPHDDRRGAPQVVPVEPISESDRRHRARGENVAPRARPPAEPAAAKPTVRVPKPSPKQVPTQPLRAPPKAAVESAPPAEPSAPVDTIGEEQVTASPAAQGAAARPADKSASPARSSAPGVPSGSVELRRDMQLAPADWLAHIRELLRDGRRQQAVESLALFRRMHPDQPLPRDLRALDR